MPRLTAARILTVAVAICAAAIYWTISEPTPASAKINLRKAAGAIKKAAKEGEYGTIDEILEQIGKSDDPKAARVVISALGQAPPHEIMESAINALVRLGTDNVASTFDKMVKSRKTNEELLATIVAVSAKLKGDKPEKWLIRGLESKSYYVYRNAIPPLVERKSKEAVPALIDLLEHVGYKLSAESYIIRDALIALTGLDFEAIEDWRKWWSGNKDSFEPGKIEEGGKTAVARKKPGEIEGYETPEFFGVEVLSSRIVFVVDVSGSMRMWDKEAEPVKGVTPEWKQRERLTRVKHHLRKAIEALPGYTHFNVISFSWKEKLFQPKSVPANAKWKKQAISWVDKLKPDGPTNTLAAMDSAFKDKELDTIFLLSDGAPTDTVKKTKDLIVEIQDMVKKKNRLAKIKIFTFGFEGEGEMPPGMSAGNPGKPDPDAPTLEDLINFLKKLADDSGGKYQPVS